MGFCVVDAELADARLPKHETHAQQARRLYRFFISRLHMRKEPFSSEQPFSWSWSYTSSSRNSYSH